MANGDKSSTWGIQSRNALKFHKWLNKIKNERLRNGNDNERISSVKLTHAICKWRQIEVLEKELIEASREELDNI